VVRPPASGVLRLAIGTVFAAIVVVAANLAVNYAVMDEIDPRLLSFQLLSAFLVLGAILVHLRQLQQERWRHALSTLISDLSASPSGIEATAERALHVLIAGGVAQAGLVALADDGAERMRPIATVGYPDQWAADAAPRVLPGEHDTIDSSRGLAGHPWVEPVAEALGGWPWVARVPLTSGSGSIGQLMLAAKRAGPLADHALIERFGAQLSTALDHAAMYEAAYRRERELEELDRRRREFIGALAHEVRTPLTSIQAFSDLLQLQQAVMDETAEQLVSSLEHGVQRLNLLVSDLLDLGQSEGTGFTVTTEATELHARLAEVETLLRPAYLLREQALTIEVGDDATSVFADPARLEQVLLNLLSNANRYTPPGGTITARTRATGNGHIRIEVEDSGPGIPADQREHIFDAYFRVDRHDQPSVPGSGLGLAIARQLVELQNGRIWAEDREGGGSRFCVELPAVPRRRSTDQAPAPAQPSIDR
jgi:signal transduction histidine kinase